MTLIVAPSGKLMSHWGTQDFDSAPSWEKTMLFIKNLLRFYREEGKKYLYSGKMTYGESIACQSINIPMLRGRDSINLPRLLSSAWVGESGKTAYIVVNPEEQPAPFLIGKDSYEAPPLGAILIEK